MRNVTMTDEIWTRLLDIRSRRRPLAAPDAAAMALYGPIASAPGGFVLAQVGQSLDGRIATPAGDARDISGPDGIAHLHRCRALVEAVIIGVETVRLDNPRLSVRAVAGPCPVRVVIDCRADLSGEEGLFHDGGAPVIVIRGRDAPRKSCPGAEIVRLDCGATGIDPQDILAALAARGLNRILVEGGARTIARFIDARLVDHLHVAVAPLIIGSGPSGLSLPPIDRLTAAYRPRTEVFCLGSDILFDCRLKAAASGRQGEKIRMADHA